MRYSSESDDLIANATDRVLLTIRALLALSLIVAGTALFMWVLDIPVVLEDVIILGCTAFVSTRTIPMVCYVCRSFTAGAIVDVAPDDKIALILAVLITVKVVI